MARVAKAPSNSKANAARGASVSSKNAAAKKAPPRGKAAGKAGKATGAKKPAATPKAKTTKTAKPAKQAKVSSAPSAVKKPPAAPAGGRKPTARTARAANDTGASVEPAASGSSLKQRFAALQTATREITGMKRSIATSFFDVGVILNRIRDKRLYEVKGYGSFESFVEREISLNKVICLRSARIAQAIDRDIAVEAGLDRAAAAVAALDGEAPAAMAAGGGAAAPALIPLHKQ